MKNKNKLNMMDGIDDELIDRANPDSIKPKSKRFSKKLGMLAACLVIAIAAVNLAIFLPMANDDDPIIGGGLSQDEVPIKGDYDDIKAIIKAAYKSNDIGGDITNGDVDMEGSFGGGAMPPGSAAPEFGSDSSYVEVTDNQVQGVIEADIFKRTSSHIFYLLANQLRAYSIKGEESALVGKLTFEVNNAYNKEMYLSPDGKTATVFFSSGYPYSETTVISINVEDPTSMKIVKSAAFKGEYVSSRYVQGELLVFTRFYVTDTRKTENYIPSVDTGTGYEILAADCIVAPEQISTCSYLTVSKLKEDGLEYCGSVALLGYDGAVYVSKNSIYVSRSIQESKTEKVKESTVYTSESKTEIAQIAYTGQLLSAKGTVRIDGTVKDQYCMDEYNGILRVASSTSKRTRTETPYDKTPGFPSTVTTTKISASLFCIDVDTLKVVASVKDFAPQGESVQSARFDGDKAYVCTAIVFTDPVFVFDLSDLENITYKDTGTIEGYSHSLIELEGGYLLGIGQTGWTTVKIELYKETGTNLESVSKIELENAYSTTNYKAIYVNRKELMFGFAYAQYAETQKTVYSVFKIENEEITVAAEFDISEKASFSNCRGVLIDSYFYVLTDDIYDNFHYAQIK